MICPLSIFCTFNLFSETRAKDECRQKWSSDSFFLFRVFSIYPSPFFIGIRYVARPSRRSECTHIPIIQILFSSLKICFFFSSLCDCIDHSAALFTKNHSGEWIGSLVSRIFSTRNQKVFLFPFLTYPQFDLDLET